MFDDLRRAVARRRDGRALHAAVLAGQRLLSERGQANSVAIGRTLIEHLGALQGATLDGYFEHLARDLSPDPASVLQAAQAYHGTPDATRLIALVQAAEPPRQALFRRLNRTPGGTACILRLRRELLRRLPSQPGWAATEADLLHLLESWFNPGFLNVVRVDWNSPAQMLEKIIQHEAVHAIDGWDDLRRRLQPDRRCFAFFHPQLPDAPLIFVEVALLPEMPAAIAPLIDKASPALPPEHFRVAAFYSISNCEPGLRGVSLGNFLIKRVAEQLQRELPQLRRFCTLSPVTGLANWLSKAPALDALPGLRRSQQRALQSALERLRARCGGDLAALQQRATLDRLDEADTAALLTWAAAWLLLLSPTPAGDPVARFHLDNGARLERLNPRGDLSPKGLKQGFGVMVNYLYDLDKVEVGHEMFRQGKVAHSRAVQALL